MRFTAANIKANFEQMHFELLVILPYKGLYGLYDQTSFFCLKGGCGSQV